MLHVIANTTTQLFSIHDKMKMIKKNSNYRFAILLQRKGSLIKYSQAKKMGTQSKIINLEQLKYDPQNPRLPLKIQSKDEEYTLDYMLRNGNIIELMQSIAELGYSDAEPLLVVKAEKGGFYYVVEGNRRLTALKLLNEPGLAKVRVQQVEQVSKEAGNRPVEIPCIVYDSRDDILSYLGFRHITGIKEWGSLEKARYLRQLFNQNVEKEGTKIYKKLAKMIGSRSDYVEKLHVAYDLYSLANDKAYFGSDIQEEDINFSYYTTALGYSSIQMFLGVEFDGSIYHLKTLDENNYEQLFLWMFDKNKRVIREVRQISDLAKIVASERALEKLKSGASLKVAIQYTTEPEQVFISYLNDASVNLKEAKYSIEQLSEKPLDYDDKLSEIEKLVKSIRGGIEENFSASTESISLTRVEYEKIKGLLEKYNET